MRSSEVFTRISPVILIILLAVHTSAVPPLPAEFFGSVLLDGSPAPAGTVITAQIMGINRGSLVTEVPGFYGGPGLFDTRLKVNVSEEEYIPGGLEIIFMINGRQAGQQAVFEAGSSVQLDLSAGGGGTSTPAAMIPSQDTPPVQMVTPVYDGSSSPASSGSDTIRYGLDQAQVFSSDDGLAELSFERDTMLLTPEGQFLTVVALRSRNIADIPSVPVDSAVTFSGYAYEIIPSGTSFNPKGKLTLTLPPERAYQLIQAGPVLYRFNPQTGIWEPVVTDANVFANIITAEIPDATIFGLFTHTGANDTDLNTTTPDGIIAPASLNAQIEITGNNSTISSQVIPLPVTSQSLVTPLTVPQETAVNPLPPQVVQEEESGEASPAESVSLPPGEDANLVIPGQLLTDHPVFRIIVFLLVIVVGNLAVYLIYTRWWIHRR